MLLEDQQQLGDESLGIMTDVAALLTEMVEMVAVRASSDSSSGLSNGASSQLQMNLAEVIMSGQ